MNYIPIDILNLIFLKLSITEISNFIRTCQQFSRIVNNNITFWKSYIKINYPDYQLCEDDKLFEQLQYLFNFHKTKQHAYYDYYRQDIKDELKIGDKLLEKKFIEKNKLEEGDIINIWDHFHRQQYILNNDYLLPITTYVLNIGNLKLIDKYNLDYWNYPFIRFKFDTTLYLDQITKNLEKDGSYTNYKTWFRHKYGKKYYINFRSGHKEFLDIKNVISSISSGNFILDRQDSSGFDSSNNGISIKIFA